MSFPGPFLAIVLVAIISLFGHEAEASWNSPVEKLASSHVLFVNKGRVEVLGEVLGEEIGVSGGGSQQYGIPGAGAAGFFLHLAAHALFVQGQRSHQLEKLREEATSFGSVFSDQLGGISRLHLLQQAIAKMPDQGATGVRVDEHIVAGSEFSPSTVNFEVNISRDYKTLGLSFIVGQGSSAQPFILRISNTKEVPYVDDSGKVRPGFDVKLELYALLQESLRVYFNRDSLIRRKASSQTTFRSIVGGKRRFERGLLIGRTCDRHLYENLSGIWVIGERSEKDLQDPLCSGYPPPSIK